MITEKMEELQEGFRTAYIDGSLVSNIEYKPSLVSNNPDEGKKVISSIEEELLRCEKFQISVAFITMGGITPLLQTLKELENRGIQGEILTTNYLDFSEPRALAKLNELRNITLKMYDVDAADKGFHTKGYIFKKKEIYRIILGSSNMTNAALTSNIEWNTKIISTEQGEVACEIVKEFHDLWNSEYALDFDKFYEVYKARYNIIKHQREDAKKDALPSFEKYTLKPNSMQENFIVNLQKIIEKGEERALLISATGTGKTYASAFAMRELGFRKVLFLVHRGQLARQTKKSYERVFVKAKSMGLVGAGYHDYDADYVFATVQTLNRDEHLLKYDPKEFDCIVLDEAHHVPADTYQKIMKHFTPKLWLGMTATPDKRDDNVEGRNVYELFNYQIAYEIRLQQAMKENLLCPFHYFGISDLVLNGVSEEKNIDFNMLTSDERVKQIADQANYYGFSGDRVKGLIFCSKIKESEELSRKFNQMINPETGKYFRTIALNGSASDDERQIAFERLAMNESEAESDKQPLDYIFSVEILNEGVDIVEVNQVIMLRPTQSPIVFIQQLGRGLRKADGKEFVVILDFIGNYNSNFMIPVALSGDRTYNPDTIRKYVISGNNIIHGASTIHFDEVSKTKIFSSIDKIKGLKDLIRESYVSLKNRLGRTPYLIDFYENGEIDPLVIIREFKTYNSLLKNVEKKQYNNVINGEEEITLEYLNKLILSGVRPHEIVMLKEMILGKNISKNSYLSKMKSTYGYELSLSDVDSVASNLGGHFVAKQSDFDTKYVHMDILKNDVEGQMLRVATFADRLAHAEFYKQIMDIIEVGLRRYDDIYKKEKCEDTPFVLYEKYSRRDVSYLTDCGKDLSSVMYGKWDYKDDVFLFVTYHKQVRTKKYLLTENQIMLMSLMIILRLDGIRKSVMELVGYMLTVYVKPDESICL
ncbi:MAG: DUF3427 domain-containing protein [Lachnospiraceae bacterium]|nr:DUF3427 domain-containing protein [Lachnospiraceae bacterium]